MDNTEILIVDDDQDILTACRLLLKKHFGQIVTTREPGEIPPLMAEHHFDVILLDMNFQGDDHSGKEGLYWLEQIQAIDPRAVVVLITAFSSVDAAVNAMKSGAVDFIEKPWNNEKLIATLNHGVRLRRAEDQSHRFRQQARILREDSDRRHHPIIGQSQAIRQVLDRIAKAAPTDANILILGENGTGKELVAREIHARSRRAAEDFVSVDLGAVPENLLESELFGHKRGAFTDAREDRLGRFQAAHKGSFFLDEIGNLPLTLQPKLLRALENREVTPLGATRAEKVDIRLISATNLAPSQLKQETTFRQDLLYRLNTVEILIPPLRERKEDIPLLVDAFLAQYTRKYNRSIDGLSRKAIAMLMAYTWPGNVRELRYSIERAVILSDDNVLHSRDFSSLDNLADQPVEQYSLAAGKTLEEIEEASVRQALDACQGNVSRAARSLGITRTSLYRRMQKYDL